MQREQPDDDAVWRAIVDNYGDPVLDPDDADAPAPDDAAGPVPAPEPVRDDEPDELRSGHRDPDDTADPDAFVPPTPPPLPRPSADRFLAWLGVFGSPAVLLFFVVTGIDMPRLLGWTLVGAFLVGFGYLVLRMPSDPRDPWDDGAQV